MAVNNILHIVVFYHRIIAMSRLKRILSSELSLYVYAVVLCFFFLFWYLQLWNADFYIPFDYHWDALNTGASIKGMIDTHGWYVSNNYIGAPYGFLNYDFSSNVNLDMGIMKIISLIVPNWAFTLNVYFILTFILVTITTLFVFRKLGLSPLVSIVGSLLFAFAPYHFLQGEMHLNLSAYYLIPLFVLVCLWLFEEDFSLKLYRTYEGGNRHVNGRAIGAILICLFTGATFIYYPYFSCFFLIIAGAGAAIGLRKWQPLFNSLILIVIVVAVVIAFDIPALVYQIQNGSNHAIVRLPSDSELYGLKIIQLLLPVAHNPNPFLAALADRYNNTAILNLPETLSASLGLIGSIGFIFLVVWVFYNVFVRKSSFKAPFDKISRLSTLNLAAVILGTLGGLGTLIAYIAFPEIRTYTRVSIFIAFFSLLAFMLIVEYLIKKTTFSKIVTGSLLAILLVVGINDQASPAFVPDYYSYKASFNNDDKFVKLIEAVYPDDKMIFQLPYVAYPEGGITNRLSDYDLIRGYLHSTGVSWSYGAMKGRYGDFWMQVTAQKPAEDLVKDLVFSGFNGIYIDTFGYADSGAEIIHSLSVILNVTPIVSANRRLVFFDLAEYGNILESQYSAADYETARQDALYPLWPQLTGDFLPQSSVSFSGLGLSQSGKAAIIITNLETVVRKVKISARFSTGDTETVTLTIKDSNNVQTILINEAGYDYSGEFNILPGNNKIELTCNAKPVYDSSFATNLVFGMDDFRMTEIK
jgi:hypothetical protein